MYVKEAICKLSSKIKKKKKAKKRVHIVWQAKSQMELL